MKPNKLTSSSYWGDYKWTKSLQVKWNQMLVYVKLVAINDFFSVFRIEDTPATFSPINDGKTRKNLREFILLRSNWGCNLFFKVSLFPRKGTELRGKMDHNCRINFFHDNWGLFEDKPIKCHFFQHFQKLNYFRGHHAAILRLLRNVPCRTFFIIF